MLDLLKPGYILSGGYLREKFAAAFNPSYVPTIRDVDIMVRASEWHTISDNPAYKIHEVEVQTSTNGRYLVQYLPVVNDRDISDLTLQFDFYGCMIALTHIGEDLYKLYMWDVARRDVDQLTLTYNPDRPYSERTRGRGRKFRERGWRILGIDLDVDPVFKPRPLIDRGILVGKYIQ